jgi:NAD(P)H-dependent FMN reductase
MNRTDSATVILVLVGSLRAASVNRQLAELATVAAPDHVRVDVFERLAELPHYNEDIDTDPYPDVVRALRGAARASEALLVATPEYNGSTPGVLKNAIDWLSRPYGNSPLKGKPAAVIGASLGQYGGRWAHDDTRKALGIAGLRVIDDLSLSIPISSLRGCAPADRTELVDALRAILNRLADNPARPEG